MDQHAVYELLGGAELEVLDGRLAAQEAAQVDGMALFMDTVRRLTAVEAGPKVRKCV